MLVELDHDEIHDNIVAFWRPGARRRSRGLVRHLLWAQLGRGGAAGGSGAVRGDPIGAGGVPGQPRPANTTKLVCDLDGRGFEGLDRTSGVEAGRSMSRGTLGLTVAYPIAGTSLWRVMFDVDMGPDNGGTSRSTCGCSSIARARR